MASPSEFSGYASGDTDSKAAKTAQRRAAANARERNKREHQSSMTFPLNIKLAAGQVVLLQGFGPEWDDRWIVVEAKHVIGKGRPSETTIEMRKCLKGY